MSLDTVQNFTKKEREKKEKNRQIFTKLKFHYVLICKYYKDVKIDYKDVKILEKFKFLAYKKIQNCWIVFQYQQLWTWDHMFWKLFFAEDFTFPISSRKFILCSGWDKIKKISLKVHFYCLETLQFQLFCFSCFL